MKYSGIYAITDDELLPEQQLFSAVADALGAGITLLQYRSKSDLVDYKFACATKLLDLCNQHGVPLIINDDVDLCQAVGAAGVHLGHLDEGIASARHDLGPTAIIGITCHASVDEALAAENSGADYVAFGRFFSSATKPEAPKANLEILTLARGLLSIPIVAIGGINAENGASAIKAGADMLAVINDIFGSDNVAQRTEELVKLWS